jgi:hypothetical protein
MMFVYGANVMEGMKKIHSGKNKEQQKIQKETYILFYFDS